MKIRKAHARGSQTVQVGRADGLRAVTGQVAIAQIVGENNNDVGWSSARCVVPTGGKTRRGSSHAGGRRQFQEFPPVLPPRFVLSQDVFRYITWFVHRYPLVLRSHLFLKQRADLIVAVVLRQPQGCIPLRRGPCPGPGMNLCTGIEQVLNQLQATTIGCPV